MKKDFKRLLLFLLLIVLFLTCTLPPYNKGKLIINFPLIQNKTLLPEISMEPDSYGIRGYGPDGSTINMNSQQSTSEISIFDFGEWTINVDVKNRDGTIIGLGEGTTTVHSGETSILDIIVIPCDGIGTLELTITWNTDNFTHPSVESQLIPHVGNPIDLVFQYTEGEIRTSITTVQTGYYGFIIKVLDNGILVKGAVEIVRIIKDVTTYGNFNFNQVISRGQRNEDNKIQVNIIPELDNPIDVTMSGQKRQMDIDETMPLEALVPEEVGNVICVWYINGVSIDIGPVYTINDFPEGVYRIDVTAFSTDGKRAGSTTHRLDVFEYITTENYAPILDPLGDRTVDEGKALEFSIDAIDRNGDNLYFSALNLPDGSSFDPISKVFHWIPDFTQAGSYIVQFEVSDGLLTDTKDITIIVNNTIPSTNDVTILYTGDHLVKYPDSTILSAQVIQSGNVSIGDLSYVNVEFEVVVVNNDGTTNPAGTFILQCDSLGIASTAQTFDVGVYSIIAKIIFQSDYLPAGDLAIVPVYDPDGSFATGGGWINVTNPDEGNPGRANFGFIAKYREDLSTGNLEFQYKEGNINLKSQQIDWLVISTNSAQFQGIGTIKNLNGIYTFRLGCTDNEGNPQEDKFTINIWSGTDTEADPIYKALNQDLSGGNILVKTK